MKMVRLLIQLPPALKAKLDALRAHGTTASGFIRALVERELQAPARLARKKGR
jgi:mannitol/fructose-specific phosphotransferase system IIA component